MFTTSGKSIPLTPIYIQRRQEYNSNNIDIGLKSGISNPQTSMSKTRPKHFYMCFHQTFCLDPLRLFVQSRVGSGHVIIWKNGGRPTQTHNESANIFMGSLCFMHVLHIHSHHQVLIPPGYNPMKFLAPLSRSTPISPFLLSTDIRVDGNRYRMNRVNLELDPGSPTILSIIQVARISDRYGSPGFHPESKENNPIPLISQ